MHVQQSLRAQCPDLRFTQPDSLHLTLKFLGEISGECCSVVEDRLGAMAFARLSVQLAGAGVFSPRIVWVALDGADALQRQVDAALDGLFAPEHRFMGHITIARTRRMPEHIRRTVTGLEVPECSAEIVSCSLQKSHLSAAGARYETLARYPLIGS
jgi:2'-5' RNA ligase